MNKDVGEGLGCLLAVIAIGLLVAIMNFDHVVAVIRGCGH